MQLKPEFSLFADVSEEKVIINFMLLNVFEHKTEVFMSWKIGRKMLIPISDFRLPS